MGHFSDEIYIPNYDVDSIEKDPDLKLDGSSYLTYNIKKAEYQQQSIQFKKEIGYFTMVVEFDSQLNIVYCKQYGSMFTNFIEIPSEFYAHITLHMSDKVEKSYFSRNEEYRYVSHIEITAELNDYIEKNKK